MRGGGEQPVRVDGREEDARGGLLREQEDRACEQGEIAREEGAGK